MIRIDHSRLFEKALMRSAPDWPGLWIRKLGDPGPATWRGKAKDPDDDRRFTGKSGIWDLEVRWPALDGHREVLIECKSTAPRAPLPFRLVKKHQWQALAKAAETGAAAGVLWESRGVCCPTSVYLPIELFLSLKKTIGRASLPLVDALKESNSTLLRRDLGPGKGGRPRKLVYWQLDQLLTAITLPATPSTP